MKVGIFSPYWQTFGGGERYLLTVAEFFQKRGETVSIFWRGESDIEKIRTRFDIDLSGVKFIPDIFSERSGALKKLYQTSKFDLIFYVSDGSIPSLFAKKNILHFQVPFKLDNQKTITNRLKLAAINKIISNSKFTKSYIDATYGVNSDVVYPPVEVQKFSPGKKENIILSVGRFFGPLHPKKQEVLIETFRKLKDRLPGWKLVLVGGVFNDPETADLLTKLRKKSAGLPVEIQTDSSFANLQRQYAIAKIYWHATGFGENLTAHPERAEHFGITTVEAMSAGAVPIVFAGGGQKEIVQEGKSGLFWKTTGELITKTQKIASSPPEWQELSRHAQVRAKHFSKEKFYEELEDKLL